MTDFGWASGWAHTSYSTLVGVHIYYKHESTTLLLRLFLQGYPKYLFGGTSILETSKNRKLRVPSISMGLICNYDLTMHLNS